MSSREVQVNTDFMLSKRKPHSPHSLNTKNLTLKSDEEDSNNALFKAGIRIDALTENQKRL
jgi:hypothetical protein